MKHTFLPGQRVSAPQRHSAPRLFGVVESVYFGLVTGTPYAMVRGFECKEIHAFKQADLNILPETIP